MTLRTFQPSPLLKPYVTAIWDYEDLLGGEDLALSILPDTATYLCFLYADLLATGDARCMEAAKRIYERYLAGLFEQA